MAGNNRRFPSPDTNFLSGTAKQGSYRTQLSMPEESAFQQWVLRNRVPFDDSPESDYDMRGYWRNEVSGGKNAVPQVSAFDGLPHYTDKYKTPYHRSFSRESMYATPNAPQWEGDKLTNRLGMVLVDETPKKGR
jgi:DMSO/TMAO reductase YedYZ molybdopterin-dependent catalytic subunit